jgi:sortase A
MRFAKNRNGKQFRGSSLKRSRRTGLGRVLALILAVVFLVLGLYLGLLLLAPTQTKLPVESEIDLNTTDDSSDMRDRIQIEKINLEVPFYTGGAEALEKGVWHRFPDRGNPVKGGNFILSAHRFKIAGDPVLTKVGSPFYNLDKLVVGDTIRVFFNEEWYTYKVTKIYDVAPDAVQIEDATSDSKLTLYSCTLSGSADGRIVVEAKKD